MAEELTPEVMDFQPAKLTDLIPESLIDLFQFAFSQQTGFSVILLEKRDEGFVRLPRKELKDKWPNYCRYLRSKPEGEASCRKFDESIAAELMDNDSSEAKWYICHAGLADLAIPIVVNGRTLAVFFAGQRRLRGKDDELIRKVEELSHKLNHVDEGRLLEYASSVPEVTPEDMDAMVAKGRIVTDTIQDYAERCYREKLRDQERLASTLLSTQVVDCFPRKADFSIADFEQGARGAIKAVTETFGLHFCAVLLCGFFGANDLTLVAAHPGEPCNPRDVTIPVPPVEPLLREIGSIRAVDLRQYPLLREMLSGLTSLTKIGEMYHLSLELYGNSSCLMLFGTEDTARQEGPDVVRHHEDTLQAVAKLIAFEADRAVFNESRGGLLHQTAHLLRGPMHAIVGEADNLRVSVETLSPEQVRDRASKIVSAVDYLCKHVENLSLFVTSDVEEHEYRFGSYPYVKLVRKMVSQFRDAAGTRGITLKITTETPEEHRFKLDWNKLEILLTNVLDNAVKYSYSNREIAVYIAQDGDSCKTAIVNEGMGFNPDEAELLFEPYYRSRRKDRKRYIPGTGIGLSVARDIARRHGGDIKIVSEDQYKGKSEYLWSKVTTTITLRMDLPERRNG